MIVELREYHARPGQRQNWVDFMENVIIPYQQTKGMSIAGSFVGSDDDHTYVWIRTFADETERNVFTRRSTKPPRGRTRLRRGWLKCSIAIASR